MHDSRIKKLTRRTVLGAGLFAGASWMLKSCKSVSAQTNRMITSSNSDTGKKIVLINPNSNTKATKSMTDLARLETKDIARVVGISNSNAPALLTTPQDYDRCYTRRCRNRHRSS